MHKDVTSDQQQTSVTKWSQNGHKKTKQNGQDPDIRCFNLNNKMSQQSRHGQNGGSYERSFNVWNTTAALSSQVKALLEEVRAVSGAPTVND